MAIKTNLIVIMGSFALAATAWAGQAQNGHGIEMRSIGQAISAPLRSFRPSPSTWHPGMAPSVIPWRKPLTPGAYKGGGNSSKSGKPGSGGGTSGGGGGAWSDQYAKAPASTKNYDYTNPSTGATNVFQGQGFTGAIPPDTNLAVGVNNGTTQIVQLVNTSYAVYNTSGGTPLASGDLGLTLFANLPSSNNCSPNNPTSVTDGGDPVVLFDAFAGTSGRWIISQLAYNSNYTQFDYCLAVSNSSDALESYEVYDIPMGGDLPDYPKLAVWRDGIYLSANMFKLKVNRFTGAVSSTFLGAQACQFSLPQANASPLPSVTFNCTGGGNTAIYNILPADVDGGTLPPISDGSDYYLQFVDNLSSTSGNELMLYQFQSSPQSGFQLVQLGPLTLTNPFYEACGGGTCIPQLGTSAQLDSIGDRLMYRLSYRNYNGDQEMAVNQSVQLNSTSNQTAIRWYKLSSTGNNCVSTSTSTLPFCVTTAQTFDPPDTNYRWLGSIALDNFGNLGLAYSESNSSSMDPSIAITGMEAGADTTMEPETITWYGPNFQDTYSRWGDYSGMAVDPNDGCTFWYTNEYSTTTNVLGVWNFFWGTVIGSFHFNNCTSKP